MKNVYISQCGRIFAYCLHRFKHLKVKIQQERYIKSSMHYMDIAHNDFLKFDL